MTTTLQLFGSAALVGIRQGMPINEELAQHVRSSLTLTELADAIKTIRTDGGRFVYDQLDDCIGYYMRKKFFRSAVLVVWFNKYF